jgi:hypothetical protein
MAIFPSFQPGAVLDFTELLAMPPQKRPRLDSRPAKSVSLCISMSRLPPYRLHSQAAQPGRRPARPLHRRPRPRAALPSSSLPGRATARR